MENPSGARAGRVPVGPVASPGPAVSLHLLKVLCLGGKSYEIHW